MHINTHLSLSLTLCYSSWILCMEDELAKVLIDQKGNRVYVCDFNRLMRVLAMACIRLPQHWFIYLWEHIGMVVVQVFTIVSTVRGAPTGCCSLSSSFCCCASSALCSYWCQKQVVLILVFETYPRSLNLLVQTSFSAELVASLASCSWKSFLSILQTEWVMTSLDPCYSLFLYTRASRHLCFNKALLQNFEET